MNAIRRTAQLNQRELDDVTPSSASWHRDYDDTAFVYIGGLHLDLSEGDIITIFSQYGEPVWIKLARDKETGKSRGFAWLKYEDQRSCELAVDNLTGATVLGRLLNVDHTRYQKRDDEDMADNTIPPEERVANGQEAGRDVSDSESEEDQRPLLKEERELLELKRNHDDDDPMKAYMIEQKQEEVNQALKALKKAEPRKKDKHKRRRHDRSGSNEDKSHRRSSRRHRSKSRERRRSKERRVEGESMDASGSRSRRDHVRRDPARNRHEREPESRDRNRSTSSHRDQYRREDGKRRDRSR